MEHNKDYQPGKGQPCWLWLFLSLGLVWVATTPMMASINDLDHAPGKFGWQAGSPCVGMVNCLSDAPHSLGTCYSLLGGDLEEDDEEDEEDEDGDAFCRKRERSNALII